MKSIIIDSLMSPLTYCLDQVEDGCETLEFEALMPDSLSGISKNLNQDATSHTRSVMGHDTSPYIQESRVPNFPPSTCGSQWSSDSPNASATKGLLNQLTKVSKSAALRASKPAQLDSDGMRNVAMSTTLTSHVNPKSLDSYSSQSPTNGAHPIKAIQSRFSRQIEDTFCHMNGWMAATSADEFVSPSDYLDYQEYLQTERSLEIGRKDRYGGTVFQSSDLPGNCPLRYSPSHFVRSNPVISSSTHNSVPLNSLGLRQVKTLFLP